MEEGNGCPPKRPHESFKQAKEWCFFIWFIELLRVESRSAAPVVDGGSNGGGGGGGAVVIVDPRYTG